MSGKRWAELMCGVHKNCECASFQCQWRLHKWRHHQASWRNASHKYIFTLNFLLKVFIALCDGKQREITAAGQQSFHIYLLNKANTFELSDCEIWIKNLLYRYLWCTLKYLPAVWIQLYCVIKHTSHITMQQRVKPKFVDLWRNGQIEDVIFGFWFIL